VISDLDIWRAPTRRSKPPTRPDLMLDRGDLEGRDVWGRIRLAIRELQAPRRGPAH
jgi:hypothetical protein